ncbi:MAG: DNA-deoxyinosine glycosylase [Oscillospiraceae bacterium]|nr:DNA-deoxyinosine glycosylase [Oscillospiraceae bacterium]
MVVHPISPVYNAESRILILGSFPSVKSRENEFFYGHPQNRFWKVLAAVYEREVPQTVEQKKELLLTCKIALWDVIASCDIAGSADSTIKNAVPNDVERILNAADIGCIYVNGKTAEKYYNRFLRDRLGRQAVCLPSTSPANAAWNLERLVEQWKQIRIE